MTTTTHLHADAAGAYPYRVDALRVAAPVVLEVELTPVGRPLPYRPGQYVMLDAQRRGVPERAYSVADAPRPDGRVRLLVTRHDHGVTSRWVHDRLAHGDEVRLTGPFGTLVADPSQDGPVLLLAAGCGIAPIGALAESLVTDQPSRPVTLCFSGRTPAHALSRRRLEQLERRHAQLRYVCTLTRDPAAPWPRRLPAVLDRIVDDLDGWEVFIAGNEGFVQACRAATRRLGAAAAGVHTEEFFADPMERGTA